MSITPLNSVFTQTTSDGFGGTSSFTVTISNGNQFSFVAVVDDGTSGQNLAITIGTAQFFIDGTLNQTITFTQGSTPPVGGLSRITRTGTFTAPITNATSTVRLAIDFQGVIDFGSETSPIPRITRDTTFTVGKPASVTQSLLNINTVTRPWIVFLPSTISSNLLHIKNVGTQVMHLKISTRTMEDSTNSRQVPSNGGISLMQDGSSNWFIATYYNGGALTTDATTGGTVATRSVVLANITSGNKLVALPNPANFGHLFISGYSTTTSAPTGRLYIITGGHARETAASAYWFTAASGVAVGVFLVSDGSKWNIMGIHRGTNTVYDAIAGGYTSATSALCLSVATTNDGITPGVTPGNDEAVFHVWKTKTIQYNNGAIVGMNTNNAVNSNFRRFYRSDNVDYSAYLFVNARIGSGTVTAFPIAQYPSEL